MAVELHEERESARMSSGRAAIEDLQIQPEDEEFGLKTALVTGASLSGDREEDEATLAAQRADDKRMQDAAKAVDYREKLSNMNYDERVAATVACLGRRNTFRDILYSLIDYCETARTYDEIDEYVTAFPAYESNGQSGWRYALFLLRTGALEEIGLDAGGNAVTDEMRDAKRAEGASEETIEDMVETFTVKTTAVGREAHERFSPTARLAALLGDEAVRFPVYALFLDHCKESRKLDEINAWFKDLDEDVDPVAGISGMQAGAYLSKLEAAGGIEWKEGWVTTEEGMEVLASQGK